MNTQDIAELAAALAAGSITQAIIQAKFGPGILAAVIAYGAAAAAGGVAVEIMWETGASDMISDIASEVEDLFTW